MERKLSLAQTPLIAASQAGAGTHSNNPKLGSVPNRDGKWFSAESHLSLHPVILTNYGNCLWMGGINTPQSLSLRPPRNRESGGIADGISEGELCVCVFFLWGVGGVSEEHLPIPTLIHTFTLEYGIKSFYSTFSLSWLGHNCENVTESCLKDEVSISNETHPKKSPP